MAKGGSVGLSIEVLLIATIGVAAVGMLVTANTTGWGTTNILVFGTILPLIVGIAFLLLILDRAGYKVQL